MSLANGMEAGTGAAVIPSLRYRDAPAAIAWLEKSLGFKVKARYDGAANRVEHAELTLGTGMVMLGSGTNGGAWDPRMVQPQETGGRVTHGVYLVVGDAEQVYATAKAAGAEIVDEMKVMDYGGKAFALRDPEGYFWSIGEYDPWT